MKINWGWGIAIFMTLFVAFIMSMVIHSFGNKTDLEYEDYYQRELDHQQVIDATENALPFAKDVNFDINPKEITITFPKYFSTPIKSGTITFFRASDKNLDKTFPINFKNNQQSFDVNNFKSGYYRVIIEFKDETKSYYLKKEINV